MGNINLTYKALGLDFMGEMPIREPVGTSGDVMIAVASVLGIILTVFDNSSIFVHTLETYESLDIFDFFAIDEGGNQGKIYSVNTIWYLVQGLSELFAGVVRFYIAFTGIVIASDILEPPLRDRISAALKPDEDQTGSVYYIEYMILQRFLETFWLQMVIQIYRAVYAIINMTIYTYDCENS